MLRVGSGMDVRAGLAGDERSAMPSIAAIVGLPHRDATKLRKAGIRTTEALLKRAASRAGRAELAQATGLDEAQLVEWLNLADLMRVDGVGSEYSDLLETVGVGTVKALRRRSSASLYKRLVAVNEQKKLVRRLPTLSMVEGWVDHARRIDPAVR